MKRHERVNRAFTLVELLVVIVIVVIIGTIILAVGANVRDKAKVRNTQATIQVLNNALQEFKRTRESYSGNFRFPPEPFQVAHTRPTPDDQNPHKPVYLEMCFSNPNIQPPKSLRAVGFAPSDWLAHLEKDTTISPSWSDWEELVAEPAPTADAATPGAIRLAARGSIESLYYYLNDEPKSRAILAKLPQSAVTNQDKDNVVMDLGGSTQTFPLLEVNDAWGHPLRYRYKGTGFPIISSAGPDGRFDTADDIISSEL